MKHICFAAILLFVVLTSCRQESVVDQEGKEFATVMIGNQLWMAENLNVSSFRNGDPIPEVRSAGEWEKAGEAGQPAWCHYNNDPSMGDRFGKLYNWYAVNDPRGLAPEGWHVPSDDEWSVLSEELGGLTASGVQLKSATGWDGTGNGNNSSGFNALPAGGRGGQSGFTAQGRAAVFWSTTSKSRSFAYYQVLHATRTGIFQETDDKMSGFSIRCIKD